MKQSKENFPTCSYSKIQATEREKPMYRISHKWCYRLVVPHITSLDKGIRLLYGKIFCKANYQCIKENKLSHE